MFRPARQNRIFQDVVQQIQEAIIQGDLKVGDQLPAERKLIEMFGISRGTLRESLRVLEQKGLIEIKTGVSGGSVVKGVTTEQLSENLGFLIRSQKVPLRDLGEFRTGLDGMVAAMAAKRGTQEEVEALQQILAEAARLFTEGRDSWDEFIRVDEQFHLKLAKMSGNLLFQTVLETVYYNIHTYYERFLPLEEQILRENLADLQQLTDAVARHDAARARTIAIEHVSKFTSYMSQE
jgi:DNA-binding FadR family transcriptional regulator